ncbi:MAG: hypothetical protein LBH75_04855 [Treponema sp.]|nr:hypothetical protein [Treponema sp.]
MKKSGKNWMTRTAVFVMILSALVFTACGDLGGGKDDDDNNKPPVDVDVGVDYTNYLTSYSVKVKNDSNKKLVAFKGAPSASSLISGVPIGGGEHGLKKDAALFATTGDFVLFMVTEEDYAANKDNLSVLANKPFTRIYAYYNTNAENKLTYTISSILGGDKKIILQNSTSYNIELRRDGVQGELIGYAGQGSYNTTFNVEAGTYMIFPVFRKFNQSRGEIITVYPKYQGGNLDGKAKFEYFALDDSLNEATLNASSYLGSDIVLKTGSAYLVIQNNHGTGMGLWDGLQQVTTSTGGQAVNPNNSLTFQIDMAKKPGSNDEYLDTSEKAQFKVGTPAYSISVPSFTFESDKIYSLTITGTNPGDINLSEITEIGIMSFDD